MALYRQHDASACQVAIDAGEWQRIGPSEPEHRYLEWMQTYVTRAAPGRRRWSRRGGAQPRPPRPRPPRSRRPSHRRRSCVATYRHRPAVRCRRCADGWRGTLPTPTVVGRWSEQFLGPLAGPIDGTTLVVEAEAGEPWVARPPADTFAGRTTRQSWARHRVVAATVRPDRGALRRRCRRGHGSLLAPSSAPRRRSARRSSSCQGRRATPPGPAPPASPTSSSDAATSPRRRRAVRERSDGRRAGHAGEPSSARWPTATMPLCLSSSA